MPRFSGPNAVSSSTIFSGIPAPDDYLSRVGSLEEVDKFGESGFARAVGARHGDIRASLYLKRDSVNSPGGRFFSFAVIAQITERHTGKRYYVLLIRQPSSPQAV